MITLAITILTGGTIGWLCHGRLWRALVLSVLASAACFGIAWRLKAESQEILIQWAESQLEINALAFAFGFLLPCAAGAAVAVVLYQKINGKGRR